MLSLEEHNIFDITTCESTQLFQFCLTLSWPYGTEAVRFLCPWDSPGQNTGVGCHALLQGIFLTQGSNPHLLCLRHWQAGSLPPPPPRKPLLSLCMLSCSVVSYSCDPVDLLSLYCYVIWFFHKRLLLKMVEAL